MESLIERFDALLENQLQLYEAGSDKIDDQILYWDITRQENVLYHYARKKGLTTIGLQPVPSLATSEHRAKQAILMSINLKSLKNSAYGSEPWTMQDTSFEIFNAPPQHTFKKGAFTVDVYYDGDKDNYYPYTAWTDIYYQNGDNVWHKVEGQGDYEGLFYTTVDGVKVYYITFDEDAARFSKTGKWTVKYKNREISSTSVTSTSTSDGSTRYPEQSPTTRPSTNTLGQKKERRRKRESSSTDTRSTRSRTSQSDGDFDSSSSGRRVRRRRREREPAAQRREQRRATTRPSVPTPDQVGSGHRLAKTKGLGRLGQLQEEAWDPYLLLLKGQANTLKCFRHRMKGRYKSLFYSSSTVFSWVGEGSSRLGEPRMLIAFKTSTDRQLFLKTVILPKGTTYSYGNLDSL